MTTLYIVRHGEYENPLGIIPGMLPMPLSSKGKEEAKRLRRYFKDKHISLIYSSSVLRCMQTAKIISGKMIKIKENKRLLETFSSYQGYWKEDWNGYYEYNTKFGGESEKDVLKRMIEFFREKKFGINRNYVISTHADPMYFWYMHITGCKTIKESITGEIVSYPEKGSVMEFARINRTVKWSFVKYTSNKNLLKV